MKRKDPMSTAVAAKQTNEKVARPLRVLVPLIQEDLQHGREAAERAGMPYYRAAGEKLLEAKAQLKLGEFTPWVKRTFDVSIKQVRIYMSYAEHSEKEPASSFSSLGDFIRKTRANPDYGTYASTKTSWTEPVKQVINRIDTETLNLKREELKRTDERDAQRQLALQLIDIGYKVLAKTLHPDKGGSRVAMARLNEVRNRLTQYIKGA